MAGTTRWKVACVVAGAVAAGCRPVPPPPMIPMHAGTEAEERGSTTVMVMIGGVKAGDLIFSGAGGLGLAVRVEHQQTERTALGVQLGGGRGDEGERSHGPTVHHTMIAVEAYGRRTLTDWSAATYGAGVSWFATGMVTVDANVGLAVSAPNDYVVPYARLGVAGALPIVPGAPFGTVSNPTGGICLACERTPSPSPLVNTGPTPKPEWFTLVDLGAVFLVGGGNRISVDLGFAHARDQTIGAISIADAQRRDPAK